MAWMIYWPYLIQLLVADVAKTTSTNQDRTTKKCFKNRCLVSVFIVGSSAAFSAGGPLSDPLFVIARAFYPTRSYFFEAPAAGILLRSPLSYTPHP